MKIQHKTGSVEVTRESVTIGRQWKTLGTIFHGPVTYPANAVRLVTIVDPRSQYLTGKRIAGAVVFLPVALLAPTRKRATLVIAVSDGTVHEFDLPTSEAKRNEMIVAQIALLGYRTDAQAVTSSTVP
jgi:hypothetical protein